MERRANGKHEKVFVPYFECVINQAERKLKLLGLKNEKVIEKIAYKLVEKCKWIPLRCLIFEMHELKEKGMLLGKDSKQMYKSYLRYYLSNEKYLLQFNEKYPLVEKFINEKIDYTFDFVKELLCHLQQDKQIIEKKLCNGKKIDQIEDMEIFLSDEHMLGKTVARLYLNNGCIIYYKPKDLSVNRFYQEIYAWLMKKCGRKTFSYAMICKKAYGWEKDIVSKPCYCEEEVERYYQNIGIHLSLSYVLGVSDLHFENIIAHGEYPIVIDVECIGGVGCNAFVKRENIQDYLDDNVLSTGLLPVNSWMGGDISVGGIEDMSEQQVSFRTPVILNQETAEMSIGYDYPKIEQGENVPMLVGKKCDYRKYIKQIIEGFDMGYTCILQNKGLFNEKFQYGFKAMSRVLIRNTQEYYMYGNLLNFPELMQDEARRREVLRHMEKGLLCYGKNKEKILNYEMQSVYKGEIPIFYSKAKNLVTGSGEILENYYKNNVEERIKIHISKMSEKVGELQKKIINIHFYSLFKRQRIDILNSNNSYPRLCHLTPEKIADYLIQNMWIINGKYEWVTLQYLESGIYPGIVDNYLYGGMSGLALFFAALSKKYNGCSIYRSVLKKIVCQIKLHTDNGVKHGDNWAWGLFTGEASIIYTYLLLHRIMGNGEYLLYAKKQANKMMIDDISRIDGDDLLSGKAGVIIAYLKLYEYTNINKYLDFAVSIAEDLFSKARKKEKGIGWFNTGQSYLSGIAHGNSGIALAFAFLWKYCKEEKYIKYIEEAIVYEDSLYDSVRKNWFDVRGHEFKEKRDTVAWCYGCGGIFLARKKIQDLTGITMEKLFSVIVESKRNIKDYSENIWNVVEKKLRTHETRNSCLCHGILGTYSVLKQINEKKARKYQETIQHYILSFEDMNNVGIMNGLTGIGYYALLKEEVYNLPDILGIE